MIHVFIHDLLKGLFPVGRHKVLLEELVPRTEADVVLLHGEERDVDVDEAPLDEVGLVEAPVPFVEGAQLDKPLKVADRELLPLDLARLPGLVDRVRDLLPSRVAQEDENGAAVVHPDQTFGQFRRRFVMTGSSI